LKDQYFKNFRISKKLKKHRFSFKLFGKTSDNAVNFLLKSRQNFGAGKLNAGQTRNIGTYLKPDKTPENDFHALILESKSKIQLSKWQSKGIK
jgi:hypothetical protein